jgi:hypothetical protein
MKAVICFKLRTSVSPPAPHRTGAMKRRCERNARNEKLLERSSANQALFGAPPSLPSSEAGADVSARGRMKTIDAAGPIF